MPNIGEKVSFYIHEVVEGVQSHVIGRCGDSPIRRGDVFALGCRYKPRERLEEFSHQPTLLDSIPVSLRVLEIHTYDRQLDELGAGMTGSLVLGGEGLGRIGPGIILEAKAAVPIG
jgi:hypothetical protein